MYPSMAPHDFPIFPNKITFLGYCSTHPYDFTKAEHLDNFDQAEYVGNGPNTTRSRSAIGCVDPSKSWQ